MSYNQQFVKNQDLSAGFVSDPQLVFDGSLFAIQLAFTGDTCEFAASLEVSNDAISNGSLAPVNFDPLANSSQSFTEAGTFTYNISPGATGYTWIRLVISDNSSGSNDGSLSATITVKG